VDFAIGAASAVPLLRPIASSARIADLEWAVHLVGRVRLGYDFSQADRTGWPAASAKRRRRSSSAALGRASSRPFWGLSRNHREVCLMPLRFWPVRAGEADPGRGVKPPSHRMGEVGVGATMPVVMRLAIGRPAGLS
jgi:hypothetical protein